MTAMTPEAPAAPVKPGTTPEEIESFTRRLKGGAWSTAITALTSWTSGVAAHHGWHISLPFMATWLVLLLAVILSHHFTRIIGCAWHDAKVIAAPEIKMAELAGEKQAEEFLRQLIAQKLHGLL